MYLCFSEKLAEPWSHSSLEDKWHIDETLVQIFLIHNIICNIGNIIMDVFADRTVIHQLDHVLRHNFPLLQLEATAVPPDGSLLKHEAAKQELLSELTSVVTSQESQ